MAANSTPSATSSGLSQALIDYNSALHGAAFHALKPPLGWRLAGAVRRTAKMALWAGGLVVKRVHPAGLGALTALLGFRD